MQGYWDAARCPRRPEKASAKRKPEATVKIPSQNKRAKKKYNCLINIEITQLQIISMTLYF